MTDLETACRELVAEFRIRARTHRDRECQLEIENCADELERALEEHMDPEVKHLVEQMEGAT